MLPLSRPRRAAASARRGDKLPLSRGAAAVAAVAALGLAGCGGTTDGAAAAPTPAAGTTAAAVPTPAAGTTPAGGEGGGAITRPPAPGAGDAAVLPAGFPLPPGTTVGPVAVGGNEITATLTIPEGKAGYDFWRQRLPAAGYTVQKAEMVGGIGEITFSGTGCGAGSQLGISDRDVRLECTR